MNSNELQDAQRRVEQGKPLKPDQRFTIILGSIFIVGLVLGAVGCLIYAVLQHIGLT